MFLLLLIFFKFSFAIDCFSCVYVETGNFTFGDENCAFGENDIAWETCEDDVSGCFSLKLEGSMNSTVFANSSALAVQRGCMLPDVEFCGEQLFRMVELNLIDNIGEAFGFNTTNFNISDPFLSANFTEPNMTCCFDDFCNCDFCQQVELTLPPTTLPVLTTQATATIEITRPLPLASGVKFIPSHNSIISLMTIFLFFSK